MAVPGWRDRGGIVIFGTMPACYAAFLRGINLGRRRVTGAQLAAPFTGLGFRDVATFLASGNVVFDPGPGADATDLGPRIETRLADDLGFSVSVFLRTAPALADMVARTPFPPGDGDRPAGKLQVILLREAPSRDAARAVLAQAPSDDRLAFHSTELYWRPRGNMSDSTLDLDAIDRLVGPYTIRTHNTLARLHGRFFADGAPA
jgi:uncharacterized protein (DUF1697 family)